jgi:hypothetical protein
MAIQHEVTDTNKREEVSLKQMILKFREWYRYLLTRWLVIGVFCALGGVLGFLYGMFNKPKYAGELTFVLEDGAKGGSGGLASVAGLASQMGISLGGGASIGVFSSDNILEFLKTRLMVEKSLLSPIKINGKEISLADFYIDISGLREQWEDDPKMKGKAFHFPPSEKRGQFSREEDSVLFVLYKEIVKKDLTVNKPDKKTSFISVKTVSPSEVFAKAFTERLVKVAIDFYVDTKVQRSRNSVNVLQAKADSILELMNQKAYSAAETQDLNQNPIRQIARVKSDLVTRDKTVLQAVYAEVLKNLEMSKLSMSQEMPIIQIVDTPIMPLKKEGFRKLVGAALGVFIFGFLTVFILIIRKMISDVMKEA